MSPHGRLISLALLMFAAAVILRASPAAQRPGQPSLPVFQSEISAQYAGSDACARCHDVEYRQWARSLHVRMTKPAAEALIAGNFGGVSFADHGRSYRMESQGGRRFISVAHGDGNFERFEVHYTLGAKRFQGYLSRLPDGRIYVLPAFWNVAQRRWVDWKEITPVPDGHHDVRQIWNVTCFNCHATNLESNFDPRSNSYRTTWTEMGLGCEACHGPGKPHIALMEEWERNPASKPAYDTRATNRALGATLRIFSPRTAEPRQVFDVCAYCHGNKNSLFLGFVPGRRLEDFALPFLVSQPMPDDDPQGDFWPDGRPSRFNRPQALTLSGCFLNGEVTCTNCHVAHGSRHEHSLKVPIAESDRLCTQCHDTVRGRGGMVSTSGPSLEQHTHHPAASAGSRCIECHMSNVNWRLLIRRRDHTFAPPVPEMTAKYGVPNACTTCHDERTPEWAARTMDAWFGDGERRAQAMRVADAFYLAGAGDPSALPALASLVVDRGRGMLVRASAAEYIGQVYLKAEGSTVLMRSGPSQTSVITEAGRAGHEGRTAPPDGPAAAAVPPPLMTRLVNALIGAANDPEPAVRAAATRALGALRDPRGQIPVVARLRDPVRSVRTAAAEALMTMGIAWLPEPAGALLTAAQDELAASYAAFPDVVTNHASRGWLESARGRQAEAAAALDTAIALDPQYARAHVYRGIVAARSGEPDKALKYLRMAKEIDPAYPNLDRMIAEAERQSSRER